MKGYYRFLEDLSFVVLFVSERHGTKIAGTKYDSLYKVGDYLDCWAGPEYWEYIGGDNYDMGT